MVVDDARILDAKACQLETWTRRNPGQREYWVLPACNFTGNLELGVGGARLRSDAAPEDAALQIQGKTLLRPLEANGWGLGLVAGAQRHPRERGPGKATDPFATLINSHSFHDDRFLLHLNAGAVREGEFRRVRATAGGGAEFALSERLALLGEAFKMEAGRPQYQLGARFMVVPDRVQLDATVGHRFGRADGARWVTLGLRLQTPAFLP